MSNIYQYIVRFEDVVTIKAPSEASAYMIVNTEFTDTNADIKLISEVTEEAFFSGLGFKKDQKKITIPVKQKKESKPDYSKLARLLRDAGYDVSKKK